MRLLLDTQVAIWWLAGDRRMSRATQAIIRTGATEVFVSRISLWEMAIKTSTGSLRIDLSRFAEEIERTGFRWLGLETSHILMVATLPSHADHRDPFDRLLVAQSLVEPLILLTADRKLARYGATVRVI